MHESTEVCHYTQQGLLQNLVRHLIKNSEVRQPRKMTTKPLVVAGQALNELAELHQNWTR